MNSLKSSTKPALHPQARVAVVGYGLEGQSTIRFLRQHGLQDITIFDQNHIENLPPDIKLGDYQQLDLRPFDIIFRTPSFNPHHPALTSLEQVHITSQTNLFLEHFRHQTIGVTGTKGKGTTASLLAHIITTAGRQVHLLGNIGQPLLDAFDTIKPDHLVVAELSSFQLWDAHYSPHIAIGLMVASEHLEQHQTLDDYLQAKSNLFRHQTGDDLAIFNADSPLTVDLISDQAQPLPVGRHVQGRGIRINQSWLDINSSQGQWRFPIPPNRLIGSHNLDNIAAAVAAADYIQISHQHITQGLSSYQPLPHRLELVAQQSQIIYVDDSISTTPPSTLAAVAAIPQPMVLILGGHNPDIDWSDLLAQLNIFDHLKAVVVVGQTTKDIIQASHGQTLNYQLIAGPSSMTDIVKLARQTLLNHANQGVVLLSPAAKSFDMFKNYQDRGQQFKQAVILQL